MTSHKMELARRILEGETGPPELGTLDPGATTDKNHRTAVESTHFDPTGLFDAGAVPSIMAGADLVYAYVEGHANALGKTIPKNRGLPPLAAPENMLSVEEKAMVILGRAIGVTWNEIRDRVCGLRHERGEVPPTRDFYPLTVRLIKQNKEIVAAIHADLLEATEAFSPLVGGTHRFMWRAKVLEGWRRRYIAIATDDDLEPPDRDHQLRMIDLAMRPHLDFFDKLGAMGNPGAIFASPGDKVREQAQTQAEADLKAKKDAKEIDDEEYVNRLRLLRFGSEE